MEENRERWWCWDEDGEREASVELKERKLNLSPPVEEGIRTATSSIVAGGYWEGV